MGIPAADNRIISKDAPEVVLIWKNFILQRQKYAGGINQVKSVQIVFDAIRSRDYFFTVCGKMPGVHVASLATIMHGTLATFRCRRQSRLPGRVHWSSCCSQPKADLEKFCIAIEQA